MKIAVIVGHPRPRSFCEALAERGVLCKETHGTVIRLAPPLVVTREELAWATEQLVDVLG